MFIVRAGESTVGISSHKVLLWEEVDLHLSSTECVGFGQVICRGDAVPGTQCDWKGKHVIREMVTQGAASFRTVKGSWARPPSSNF